MMEQLIKFLRSPQAPVLAVSTLALGYLQMYGKLYYQHGQKFDIIWFDMPIAIVVAVGLSLATIILIVQTENLWVPAIFAFLDFIACVLYFNVLDKSLKEALPGLLISIMSAAIVFALGELFVRAIRKLHTEKEEAQQVREKLTAEFAKLRAELTKANEGLTKANQAYQQQVASLEEAVAERELALSKATDRAEQLSHKLEKAQALFLELQEASTEWKEVFEKEMQRRERLSLSKSK